MIRAREGYNLYAVAWGGYKTTAPCLMHWAVEVAKRMRRRGHNVTVLRLTREGRFSDRTRL